MRNDTPLPEQCTDVAGRVWIPGARDIENSFPLNARVLTAVTPPQWRLVEAIRRHYVQSGAWPSGCSVARAVGVSVNAVTRQLRRLERIGVLRWTGPTVAIVREPDGVFSTLRQVRS